MASDSSVMVARGGTELPVENGIQEAGRVETTSSLRRYYRSTDGRVECRKGAYRGAGDVVGERDVGEGGVVQQRAVKEQVGGGASRFATDTFRRG